MELCVWLVGSLLRDHKTFQPQGCCPGGREGVVADEMCLCARPLAKPVGSWLGFQIWWPLFCGCSSSCGQGMGFSLLWSVDEICGWEVWPLSCVQCNYLMGSKRAWVRDRVYAPSAQNSSKRLQTWHGTTRATVPASVMNQSWTRGGVVISLSLLKILECRVAFNPRINCMSVESYPESHAAAKIAHMPWTITVALLSTWISQVALEILKQIDFSKH